jgi:hypothetical protein
VSSPPRRAWAPTLTTPCSTRPFQRHHCALFAKSIIINLRKLAVGPIAVARWRRVIDAFEEERPSSLQSWRSSDRGAVEVVLDEVRSYYYSHVHAHIPGRFAAWRADGPEVP